MFLSLNSINIFYYNILWFTKLYFRPYRQTYKNNVSRSSEVSRISKSKYSFIFNTLPTQIDMILPGKRPTHRRRYQISTRREIYKYTNVGRRHTCSINTATDEQNNFSNKIQIWSFNIIKVAYIEFWFMFLLIDDMKQNGGLKYYIFNTKTYHKKQATLIL